MLWILQFLLGLLKIIGIVLLTIICIVLLLVLLILFGAIRYKVEGSAKNRESTGQVLLETLNVNAKVSWLNPLFRVFVKVQGKKLAYQVKVFGFCVLDSEKPPKPKKPKKSRKSQKEITPNETSVNSEAEELVLNDTALEEQTIENVPMQETSGVSNKQEETELSGMEEKPEESAQDTEIQPEQNMAETVQTNQTDPLQNIDESENEPAGNSKKKKKVKKSKKKAAEEMQDSSETGEKKKFSFAELEEKIAKLNEKKDLILEFLQEETTKLTVAGTFGTIKKVILHILPVSIRGNIIYGSGDPASTGKAFAVLGILYAKYGESLTVLADFEEKRLEADVQIKGRIRLGTMAWYFIAFVLKKETRAFIKRCMQLIKKLKA